MNAVLETSAATPSAADLDAAVAEQLAKSATTSAPLPTPEELDRLIEGYEYARSLSVAADKEVDKAKARIIALVDAHGHVPPHAEQSKRLQGKRHEATVTRGTTVTVNEPAVSAFWSYLAEVGLPHIFGRFFAASSKHALVDGASGVLKTLEVNKRIEEKIASLFGKAIDVKSKSPALKVEVIKAEKPVRTKRAGKARA